MLLLQNQQSTDDKSGQTRARTGLRRIRYVNKVDHEGVKSLHDENTAMGTFRTWKTSTHDRSGTNTRKP